MLKWWQVDYLVHLNTDISIGVDAMTGCLHCASQHRHQLMLMWWQFDYLVPLNKDISIDVDMMTGWLHCASQHRHINWCWCDKRLITLCLSTETYQLMLMWWQVDYLVRLNTDISTDFDYFVPLNTYISTDVDVTTVWLSCNSNRLL
jgi:hypothetical protein